MRVRRALRLGHNVAAGEGVTLAPFEALVGSPACPTVVRTALVGLSRPSVPTETSGDGGPRPFRPPRPCRPVTARQAHVAGDTVRVVVTHTSLRLVLRPRLGEVAASVALDCGNDKTLLVACTVNLETGWRNGHTSFSTRRCRSTGSGYSFGGTRSTPTETTFGYS